MGNVTRAGSCDEPGCDRPVHAKRMCKRHYSAWYRTARPEKYGAYLTAKRLPQPEPKTCPTCRESFVPERHNQRFCSKSHRKSYDNAKSRGTLDKLLSRAHFPGAEFDCAQCQAHCVRGENVAPHATKFCGYDCKARWHRIHGGSTYHASSAVKRRALRRGRAKRKIARAARGKRGRVCWYAGTCPYCDESFVTWFPAQRTCGEKRCRDRRERIHKGGKDYHRRRARKFGVAYEPINREEIFQRDGWVCWLCRRPIDRNADPHDARAATIDHIIPVSLGGPHVKSNVLSACRECNTQRGTRFGELEHQRLQEWEDDAWTTMLRSLDALVEGGLLPAWNVELICEWIDIDPTVALDMADNAATFVGQHLAA